MSGKRVFIGSLATETNTFSNIPTNRVSFERCCLVRGREALEHPMLKAELSHIEDLLRSRGVQLTYGLFAFTRLLGRGRSRSRP